MNPPAELWPGDFEAVRFNRFLGLRLAISSDGVATVTLPPRSEYTQENGVTHGGLIAAVADTACVYSILARLPPGGRLVGVEFKVNFLEPAPPEAIIVATAEAIRIGHRILVAEARVRVEESTIATGIFTYLRSN